MEACIAFAYLPPKRHRADEEDVRVPPKIAVAAEASSKVQDELADKFKLANAKEFHIQGNLNGQMLGCGVEVRKSPESSRFRIRIYDRDRNNAGKLRDYIELSLDDFLRIKRHQESIRRFLNYVRHSENIFRQDDFSVMVVPSIPRPLLQFTKRGSRICMSEDTFANMMSYEDTLRNEHAECQRCNDEDRQFLDDLANIVAFRRNEERANGFAREPAEWFQAGTVTTWIKFREQASKSKDRLRKKARTSDQKTR